MTKRQEYQTGYRRTLEVVVLGKLDRHMQKMDNFLTPCTRINSNWIKNLNIRLKTKFLEEMTGSKLFDIALSNFFLYISLAMGNKENKQMGLYITKKFIQ